MLFLALLWLGSAHVGWAACTPPGSFAQRLKVRPDAASYADLGAWFAEHDQPVCAAESFRKALQKQPESAPYAYLLGLSLSKAGQPGQAIVPLQRSISLDSTPVAPHLLLGSVLDQLGHRADAELQWRLALGLDPRSSAALENLSRDLLADGNYVSVIEMLRPLTTERGLSPEAAVNLSVAYSKSGLLDNAFDVLQTAIHANPVSVPVAEALSAVLVMQGRYHDAIGILSVAAQQHPEDTQLQIRYLHLLAIAHDPEAEPLCGHLLKAEPQQWELLYLMGLLRRQGGDVEGARTWFEKSVARNPNYADSHFQLGLVLASLNDNLAAKEHLEKAIALGFHDPQVHYDLGRSLRALGNKDAAQQQFQLYQQGQLADLNESRAATKSYEADQAQADGNFAQAAADYREALGMDPTEPLLAYRLAMALDKTRDVAGERSALEQALHVNPRMAVAQNQLGYLDSVDGNTDAAVQHFQLAVEADPGYTKAWMNLAAAQCMESKWHDARSALAHVLELDPGSVPAHDLLQQINAASPRQ
jgi:tetratricopeptide (TPR) repeat protein